jgi:hypothetical protein
MLALLVGGNYLYGMFLNKLMHSFAVGFSSQNTQLLHLQIRHFALKHHLQRHKGDTLSSGMKSVLTSNSLEVTAGWGGAVIRTNDQMKLRSPCVFRRVRRIAKSDYLASSCLSVRKE